MKSGIVVGVFVALASSGLMRVQPREGAERTDRGLLAILRRDGVILPFAAFSGNSWSTPWPVNLRFKELPINTDAVPDTWWGGRPPESWQAWLADGTARPLTVQTPLVFNAHCAPRLGLRTDYRPAEPVPPVVTQPFPKDGLAVAGGSRVEPIEMVDRASAEWGALAVALLKEFDRAEDREIAAAASNSGWRHPFRNTKRRSIPVRLESWYRTSVDEAETATVSWIEAVRSYPPGPEDEGCGLETFFSGWVYHEKRNATPRVELSARLTYCDRVGAMYMLPLGKIQIRQASYWIYQLSGYETEWYAVAQLSRSKVKFVAEYFAGTCR